MKLAVVTGGANGIGAVIADRAIQQDFRVAVWDVDAWAAQECARQLGVAATWSRVDVTDPDSVAAAIGELEQPPDLVVNNAGIVRFGPLVDLALEDWRAALEVNLTGTFVVSQAAARVMSRAGGGSIINIASINGVAAAPYAGAYSASKAGVVMLTQQMSLEWSGLGIRVNAVAPGLILAGMSDPIYADPETRRLREGAVPLGRLGTAEDIAAAVLFLASDQASYITGQTLTVDGGVATSALASLPRPKSVDRVGPAAASG